MFNTFIPHPPWAGARLSSIHPNDNLPRLRTCPDCKGRGYFCETWDATKASEYNCFQCMTCRDAKKYFDEHGTLPPELVARIEANAAHKPSGDNQ